MSSLSLGRPWLFWCVAGIILFRPSLAPAKVSRIVVEHRISPAFDGKSFGNAGAYEALIGHVDGELDPKDPHNAGITDIQFAPANRRGMVEYTATFRVLKPIDATKSNGVIFYAVPNRGHRISEGAFNVEGEPGEAFLLKRGYIILDSGWQGDILPQEGVESINVPVARNPDGSSITGRVCAVFKDMAAGTTTLPLPHLRPAADTDTTRATLTKRTADDAEAVPLASADWAFADGTAAGFPGVPDAAKICLKDGFDPAFEYVLTYTTKDPLVFGIGYAATRDIVSFFRYAAADAAGTANPIAGRVSHAIAFGVSQSGNFIKTFIHLGFNQDEAGRTVWDGADAHIAARQLALNFRFAWPGGVAELYEAGSEGVLWWGRYADTARGAKEETSLLDRCLADHVCPKVFETFGASEFWNLRVSPNLVGTRADADIPLPSNVRRYFFPGTAHGGGPGGFSAEPRASKDRVLAENPNPEAETMRSLLVALTDWVVKNAEPPPSAYPRLDQGDLVWPDHRAMGFPVIPGTPLPEGLINPFYDYDFGAGFNYTDLSGVTTLQPPIIKRVLPQLVPRVDADGNETSGVASVLHQAPLGTYVGWNAAKAGYYKNHRNGLAAGFIPFAKTKAERMAAADPRLSLEERYRDHDGYCATVRAAAQRSEKQRFLLPEDAARLIRQAEQGDVLR